ncbi:MAG TPA: TetR/AcrR family transcriptional regulator [Polyangiaceae bacterium]|nr:TetR/AcrR family transcriptional regulator [Polyangiaceae bacterium]
MAKRKLKPSGSANASRGGTAGSKRRPPDQARASVLAAADRLFYEQGLRAVGVDTIAEAAGVTKRTLYYHFPTKDALIAAYLEARDDAVRLAIDHAIAALADGASPERQQTLPAARILAVFDHLERWFRAPGYRGCPFNNAVAEDTAPGVAEITRRHKSVLRDWLSDQAQLAGARAPRELGAELLVLIDGALNGALVFASAEPARSARRVAITLLKQAGAKLPRHASSS